MLTKGKRCSIAMLAVLAFGMTLSQAQSLTSPQQSSARHVAPAASGAQLPVVGSGTIGRLTKWTGQTGSNAVIGDTNIFEDKNGNVGIGTTSPTSLLTVRGMIEMTLGGLKFPDGTVQTTAAVSGLQTVTHDATLTGNGTSASPLGVAVPLTLSGSGFEVLHVHNTGFQDGIKTIGGDSDIGPTNGGVGLVGQGGKCTDTFFSSCNGGAGVMALGGHSVSGFGGYGIFATGGSGNTAGADGQAGFFEGDVGTSADLSVNGDLFVNGTKNFKIDHPLDPANKYLMHAAIESSEVLNVYSGNVTTDADGNAVVALPDWFEALNRDFRYQLTVVGTFAQAIIAGKIKEHRFTIKTNAPNVEVSWQVTGVRADAVMLKHPFKVEEDKTERERGYYLRPDAYDQPEERGIEWARQPHMMRRLKAVREQMQQKAPGGNR